MLAPAETPPLAGPATSPRPLRYATVGAAVGVYIALGFLLHPSPNAYLVMGMPITVAFQVLVARRPLRELWLRDGQPLRFDRWTALMILPLLIGPVIVIINGVAGRQPAVIVYGVAAIGGAVGAAFAFRVLGADRLRQLLVVLLLMIPIGLARLLLTLAVSGGMRHIDIGARALTELESLLFYVPALFVAEEVFFRGALDSYLHRGEEGPGWVSAAFVSVLWGLWHTPIAGPLSVPLVLELVLFQLVMGLIFSWLWRQTGNLAMSATCHAILDAVRNAIAL